MARATAACAGLAFAGLAFAGLAWGQSNPSDRAERVFAKMKRQAETLYPAIAKAPELPEGILIGFLVNADADVIRHTAGMRSKDELFVTDELSRMFPGTKVGPGHGAACFGGMKRGEAKYCVYWGELGK